METRMSGFYAGSLERDRREPRAPRAALATSPHPYRKFTVHVP